MQIVTRYNVSAIQVGRKNRKCKFTLAPVALPWKNFTRSRVLPEVILLSIDSICRTRYMFTLQIRNSRLSNLWNDMLEHKWDNDEVILHIIDSIRDKCE